MNSSRNLQSRPLARSPGAGRFASLQQRIRRGVAAVEFAVVAPVFVTLLLGTINSVHALNATTYMSQAVREGGRLGASDWTAMPSNNQSPNDKVKQDIASFLRATGIDSTGLEVTITYAEGANKGQPFQIGRSRTISNYFKSKPIFPTVRTMPPVPG